MMKRLSRCLFLLSVSLRLLHVGPDGVLSHLLAHHLDVLRLGRLALDLLLQLEPLVRVSLRLLLRLELAILKCQLSLRLCHLTVEVERRHVLLHSFVLVLHLSLNAILALAL